MKRVAHSMLLALALSALSGCARIPATHYYVLQSAQDGAGTAGPASQEGLDIGVRTFRVDPPLDQDRIVYRVGEDSVEIGFYAYHRWAVPLARMLPDAVADGLAATPGVRSIEPAEPGRDYGAYLHGRVLALEEVDTPEGQTVRVRIALRLQRADGAEVWSEVLHGRGNSGTDQVSAIVEQMQRVLDRGLSEARDRLRQSLLHSAPGTHR